ncbi:MAG: hypothetical protein E7082_02715 [Bacteroidales bacterium]|nr:hypothetical protein [Bacteroidales bacterium]
MKKFTLTLAALAMTTASAFAAATLPFADGIYTIEGGSTSAHRGFLAAGEGYTEYPVLSDIGWSNYNQNSTTAIEDGKYWYITPNGTATGYYVYNVALNKFLSGEGSSVHFSDNPYNWEIVDNTQGGVTYTSIKYVSFACGTKPKNVNYHWEAADGGSTHTMTLIADGLTTYAEAVANAETAIKAVEPVLIHELADIDNESVYTINSEGRGYLYYNSENTTQLYSSSHTTITDDAAPIDNSSAWFAILRTDKTAEGQYYIYNTAAQKFLSWSGTGVAVDLVEDASYTWSITVQDGLFLIKVPETTQTYLNVTNWEAANGCKIFSTAPDVGNRMELTSVPSHGVDLSAAKAKINAAEATQQDITFTFPEFGGHSLTMTVSTMTGVDAQDVIPTVAFFNATALEDNNTIVSTENTSFTVIGDWAFPFEDEEVYRIDIRLKSAQHGCSNLLYEASTKKVNTRNTTNQDAFVPERLFYLAGKGFDATTGSLIVTLHSIAADASTGFQVAVGNNSVGAFSETPTEFRVVTNSNGTGISLQHPESNNAHVNDLSSGLGIWNHANSQNDAGSFLRFGALEDSDFDGLMEGDLAAFITQEMLDAAKASKSAADVRSLFEASAPYLAAVAEAQASLASIANYTADHFGEDLGYFYGTDYDAIVALAAALQGTLEGTDVAAITAATAALAEEVAKVQVHLPEADKYYRFKGYASNKYITPTAATGKMTLSEQANEYSVFLFQAVEGSNNTFKLLNVQYNAGITGTHSLSADGAETYTFVASEGKKAGVFTVKSNTTSGGTYLHDNTTTADRYGAYDNSNHATNWYLEEVDRNGNTGIEEINVESDKVQGIYDLQGRRLSAPVKGINIINGKKVLVK